MTEPGSLSTTAEIVPFRATGRRRDDAGQERLRRALLELERALARQREAVAAWRVALVELSEAVASLGGSMRRYRDNLDDLAVRVGGLRAQAVRLGCVADAALAVSRDCPR